MVYQYKITFDLENLIFYSFNYNFQKTNFLLFNVFYAIFLCFCNFMEEFNYTLCLFDNND